MKTTLIAIGLVALGVGQVQAQIEPKPDLPETFQIEPLPEQPYLLTLRPGDLQTFAIYEAIGKRRVWQCEEGIIPPNCNFNDPPSSIAPCGIWHDDFLSIWRRGCPPRLRKLVYWMTQCDGGYKPVGTWNFNPSGTCEEGYVASTRFLQFESPDCARTIPTTPETEATTTGCEPSFRLASMTVSVWGVSACTTTSDEASYTQFQMQGSGLRGFATHRGVDMRWYITASDNQNGTYTVTWYVSLINSGNQCDRSVVHTFSGSKTQGYAYLNSAWDKVVDCETCGGGPYSPGRRVATLQCGGPGGAVCNQFWSWKDPNNTAWGINVRWTPVPQP